MQYFQNIVEAEEEISPGPKPFAPRQSQIARHRAERSAIAAERTVLDLAKFLPPPQRCSESIASIADSSDAETRTRGSGALDARTNRARQRWSGRRLSRDAQLFDRAPRAWLFKGASRLQKSDARIRGLICR